MKAPKTFEEQIEILEKRGLLIQDKQKALSVLSNKNYYRIRAYSFHLERPKDVFIKGVSFDTIVNLYNFDRNLRNLIYNKLGVIEISLRTVFAYYSSNITKSDKPQENVNIFANKFKHYNSYQDFKTEKIDNLVLNSHERFILHHKYNYQEDFPKIPVWAMVEVITFTTLVQLTANITINIRQAITQHYGLFSEKILINWLNICCVVRNVCAHHSALWDKKFLNVIFPKTKGIKKRTDFWDVCVIIYTLLYKIDTFEATNFKTSLFSIIDNAVIAIPFIDILKEMGFPNNWKENLDKYTIEK